MENGNRFVIYSFIPSLTHLLFLQQIIAPDTILGARRVQMEKRDKAAALTELTVSRSKSMHQQMSVDRPLVTSPGRHCRGGLSGWNAGRRRQANVQAAIRANQVLSRPSLEDQEDRLQKRRRRIVGGAGRGGASRPGQALHFKCERVTGGAPQQDSAI